MTRQQASDDIAQLPRPGETLEDRYRLKKVFASGGMGVIMKAEQLRTGRDVAVKILHPHIAKKEDFAARFKREVHVATLFDHSSIVRVYDVGETDQGLLYLVMELLDGQELKALIERCAPLRFDRVLEIGTQFLDGLAEAHSQEVVHRDLKPANIFVGRDRRGNDDVKVLDFGIAKLVNAQQTQLTATGKITGTPSYVAPEALIGEQFASRKPIDVYASGLIILEMLTGRQVFEAESMAQTLLQQLKKPVPIPDVVDETPLGEVIRRATAKHPEDRYRDADEMLQAFAEAREATPGTLRLDPSEIPGPPVATSTSLLDQMSAHGDETNLEMLRKVPQHTDFSPDVDEESSEESADDSHEGPPRGEGAVTAVEESRGAHSGEKPGVSDGGEQTGFPVGKVVGGVAAAAVVAFGAFVFIDTVDDEPDPDHETQSAAEADSPVGTDQEVQQPQLDDDPAQSAGTDGEDTQVVAVGLDSQPDGALVWKANRVLGRTEVTLEFDREELPREIRLEKDGYQSETLEIAAAGDIDLDVQLEPLDEDQQPDEAADDQVDEIDADDPGVPTVRGEADPPGSERAETQEQPDETGDQRDRLDETVAGHLGGGDPEDDSGAGSDEDVEAEPDSEDEPAEADDPDDEEPSEGTPDDLVDEYL